jgi:hypothetical protein
MALENIAITNLIRDVVAFFVPIIGCRNLWQAIARADLTYLQRYRTTESRKRELHVEQSCNLKRGGNVAKSIARSLAS